MKKIFGMVTALAVVVFAGCTTDFSDKVIVPQGGTTITIGLDNARTSLGELAEDGTRKVYWSEGDQIAVNGVVSGEAQISADNEGFAVFAFESVLDYPYSILYPAEMYKDAQTITLPAEQSIKTDSFGDDCAPMAGYVAAEGTSPVLHHLAAVVRLQIKLPAESAHAGHSINKIEVRGANGEQMSGDFAIDYTTALLTAASTAEADQLVTAKVGKKLSAEEALNVFVSVPAQAYSNGFTIRIIDEAGHYMDAKSAAVTLEKGDILAMPVIDFVPTGTQIGIEISTAAEWVTFSQNYNDGVYDNIEPFVVVVTADLSFDETTSAAIEPIGGVLENGDSHYFHGYLEGGNHSIKNLVSSRPLFAYTGGGSMVKDLIIDSSCTLTANYADESTYYAAFVGYHRGDIVNCHCNAAIAASGTWATSCYVAGIVGRCVIGKIIDCSMGGDITADETLSVGTELYLGGIAGRVSNADGEISGSSFGGNISFAGGLANKENAYFGGIAGYTAGDILECTAGAELTNITIEGAHATNNIYRSYWGGIAGFVHESTTVSDCTNNTVVKVSYQRNSDATRYLFIGGVIGYLDEKAVAKNCKNAATAQSRSACKTIYIGGVVGNAAADSVIDNCTNEADVNARTSSAGSLGGRYVSIGGVIGRCATSNVSNIANSGDIEISRSESNNTANIWLGGCIGEIIASIDGANTIINNGVVSYSDTATKRACLGVGGVVGGINASGVELKNVSNTANVVNSSATTQTNSFTGGVVGHINEPATVSNVTNSGAVSFTYRDAVVHVNTGIGGIVGGAATYKYTADGVIETTIPVTIDNCTNSGTVTRSSMAKQPGSHFYAGGIIGIIKGAGSSISNCKNLANVSATGTNNSYNDAELDSTLAAGSFAVGGIAGFALGSSETALTIKGCVNEAESKTGRGYCGGIVGYSRYVAISDCDVTGNTLGTNTSNRIGGIAGYINASSITSCDVVATVDGISNAYVGGVAGGMNATATIASSTVNGTVEISNSADFSVGAIVGLSEAGATVTDCGAKGLIGTSGTNVAITTDKFCGDGLATVTGAYILE